MMNAFGLRRFARDPRGSVTVEFVATIPLILAALVFSFEFARALWAYDVMTRDVRGALRYLSRAPSSYTDQAACLAMTGIPTGSPPACGGNAKHVPWDNSSTFPAVVPVTFSGSNFNEAGSVLTMQANVPLSLTFFAFLNWVTGGQTSLSTTFTLSVSDQIRWIGN